MKFSHRFRFFTSLLTLSLVGSLCFSPISADAKKTTRKTAAQIAAEKAAAEQIEAERQATYNKDIDLGIMVETSASIIMADKLIKYSDFFSIGTNDLTQYTLACDRGNENISDIYDNFNPAVIRSIKHVIDESHKAGKWTGMCGQFASDTKATKLLLGLGLDEFSGSASKLPKVKDIIRNSNFENEEKFALTVLDLEDVEEVKESVEKHN